MSQQINQTGLNLWKGIQQNDQIAFDQFYSLYVKLLYNYGCQITTDTGLVEDCIQELFVQLWQRRQHITFQSSIKNYLLLSLRRLIAKKNNTLSGLNTLPQMPESITPYETAQQVEVQVKQQKRVLQAIEHLSKRQKEAIFLKYYENLDYDEIAQIMSLQKNGVYKLISVSIRRIRKILGSV